MSSESLHTETLESGNDTTNIFERWYNTRFNNKSFKYLLRYRPLKEFAQDLRQELESEYPKSEPLTIRLELWIKEGIYMFPVSWVSDDPDSGFWNILDATPQDGQVDIGTMMLNVNSTVIYACAHVLIPEYDSIKTDQKL